MAQVTLRTVSGKQCSLTEPFSWEAFLNACESELGLDRRTIKAHYDGRICQIAPLAEATGDVDVAKLDSSRTYSPGPSNTDPSGRLVPTEPQATTSSSSDANITEDTTPPVVVVVTVFGRPRKVQDLHAAATTPVKRRVVAARPRNPSITSSGHMASDVPDFPRPLRYPHCPDGLREIESIVNTSDDVLEMFPLEVYHHPTMQHIIREAAGRMDYLSDVMAQIAAVTPSLFAWIQRNPDAFVRMLNRSTPSLQDLRQFSLTQVARQMSTAVARGHRNFILDVALDGGMELRVVVDSSSDGSDTSDDWDDGGELFDSSDSNSDDIADDNGDVREPRDDELNADQSSENDADEEEGPGERNWFTENGVFFVDTDDAVLEALGIDIKSMRNTSAAPATTRGATATAIGSADVDHRVCVTDDVAVAAPHATVNTADVVAVTSSIMTSAAAAESREPATLTPPSTAATTAATTPAPAAGQTEPLSPNSEHESAWQSRAKTLHNRMNVTRSLTSLSDATLYADAENLSADLLTELQLCLSQQNTSSAAFPSELLKVASNFFANLEDFYVSMIEGGQVADVPGADPTTTNAGRACRAALAQQLVCECSSLLLHVLPVPSFVSTTVTDSADAANTPTRVSSRRRTTDGLPRVGALRNLPDSGSVLLQPVLQWVAPGGPQALLRALLAVVKEQPAAGLVWYTSHYFVKTEGKTVQTIGYVLASGQVKLERLRFNSKAHKQDVVTPVLERIQSATTSSAGGGGDDVPDALRAEWGTLMKAAYKNMVKPLEAHLPTPNSTAHPLYVIDTRHILGPRDASKASREEVSGRGPSRWFAGYSDEKNTLCVDKWCITESERPWHIVMAHEAPWASLVEPSLQLSLLVLGSPSTTAPYWLTEPLQNMYHFHQYAMSALPPTALHAVLLHESDCGLNVSAVRRRTSRIADRPIVADLRVIDDCASDSTDAPATQRATIIRNVSLSVDDEFHTLLYEKLGLYPSMPLGAAVRAVALGLMVRHRAPWRVVEFSLLDYGGILSTLAPMFEAHRQPQVTVATANTGDTRRAVCAREETTNTAPSPDSVEVRDYVASHGMLNVLESMVSHVMKERPATTRGVLDSLITYVESSKGALKQQVARDAAATSGAPAAATQATPAAVPRHRSIPTQPSLSAPATDNVAPPHTPHTPSDPPSKTTHRTFPRRQTR